MSDVSEFSEKIKALKQAREILHNEYTKTDFHKKREDQSLGSVPPSPEDEDILRLLTAIQLIDTYIKKFQDEQFKVLKENE